jgi:Protein of unknown function (DUF2975)
MIETTAFTDHRLKRIRNVSRLFRILCGLGVGCGFLLAIASWFAPIKNPSELSLHLGTPTPPEKVLAEAPGPLKEYRVRISLGDEANVAPMQERVKPGMRWTVRPTIFGLTLFWTLGVVVLYRLFKLYEQGKIFTAENVRCIKWIGVWVLGLWALSNVIQMLKLITYDSADVDLDVGSRFFVGVLVLLVAWIMEEGAKMREENALTI